MADMGKPKDPAALERYRRVIVELSHVHNYIQWQDGALERLFRYVPNATTKGIHQAMRDHVVTGGEIDQVEETRDEYLHWRFHYDLRLPVSGLRVYIETVLDEDDPDDPFIWIVNIHPEKRG
jgi:hypothetical protein